MSAGNVINASQLKHRIMIMKLTIATNENGFEEESWVPIQSVWASKNNLSAREFWSAKAVQSENTVEFGVRYAKYIEEIDSRIYRIVHGTRTYNITFVDNEKYKNTFVLIKTLELIA